MIGILRDPVLIDIYQHFHAFHKNIFRNLWHLHSFSRQVKSFIVIIRAENERIAIIALICLDAFKYGLPVMQRCGRWLHQQGLVRFDLDILPLTVLIISLQHVIGIIPAEWDVLK